MMPCRLVEVTDISEREQCLYLQTQKGSHVSPSCLVGIAGYFLDIFINLEDAV
jgi:hypothetical protein